MKVGRIYMIVNKVSNQKYIGSTFLTLRERLNEHKKEYKKYLNGKLTSKRKLFKNVDKYGWENYTIHLLKECMVKNETQLHKMEKIWIIRYNTYNGGLNSRMPI